MDSLLTSIGAVIPVLLPLLVGGVLTLLTTWLTGALSDRRAARREREKREADDAAERQRQQVAIIDRALESTVSLRVTLESQAETLEIEHVRDLRASGVKMEDPNLRRAVRWAVEGVELSDSLAARGLIDVHPRHYQRLLLEQLEDLLGYAARGQKYPSEAYEELRDSAAKPLDAYFFELGGT